MMFQEAAKLGKGESREMWLTHYSPCVFNASEEYLNEIGKSSELRLPATAGLLNLDLMRIKK